MILLAFPKEIRFFIWKDCLNFTAIKTNDPSPIHGSWKIAPDRHLNKIINGPYELNGIGKGSEDKLAYNFTIGNEASDGNKVIGSLIIHASSPHSGNGFVSVSISGAYTGDFTSSIFTGTWWSKIAEHECELTDGDWIQEYKADNVSDINILCVLVYIKANTTLSRIQPAQ